MSLNGYLKETKEEMKHVSWLSKKQVINYTVIVVVISLATAFYLGFFDFIFTSLVNKFIIGR